MAVQHAGANQLSLGFIDTEVWASLVSNLRSSTVDETERRLHAYLDRLLDHCRSCVRISTDKAEELHTCVDKNTSWL